MDDLPPYPDVPRLECAENQGRETGSAYSVKVANASAQISSGTCPVFAVNMDGTRLAAAWEKAGGVTLKVFEIPTNFRLGSGANGAVLAADLAAEAQTAPWMRSARVRELELHPSLNRKSAELKGECIDRTLRFSEDDRVVSFECLHHERTNGDASVVQSIHAIIGEKGASLDAASRAALARAEMVVADKRNELKTCKGGEQLPPTSAVKSLFLGRPTASGNRFVTVREDGFVQIWHDGKERPCLSTQFRSDFVRVATGGRPAALAVNDVLRPTYAIYHLNPAEPTPVVRVYEQESTHARLLMEHYPPAGVGTPVGIRFTPKARCLQIRAVRGSRAVDYYLILDLNGLSAVGNALEKDLGAAASSTNPPLREYNQAVTEQCYGK